MEPLNGVLITVSIFVAGIDKIDYFLGISFP